MEAYLFGTPVMLYYFYGEGVKEYSDKLRRKAVLLQIGGFKPIDSLYASWFGKVNLGLQNEVWPSDISGEPMLPLCQMNIHEMPHIPFHLHDIEFITIYISKTELPIDDPNGINWCLRAYKKN